jgi:hypothetical protein
MTPIRRIRDFLILTLYCGLGIAAAALALMGFAP